MFNSLQRSFSLMTGYVLLTFMGTAISPSVQAENALGKTRFTVVFNCPGNLEAEGDRIWSTHKVFMKDTHFREGPKELFYYDVSKTPELSEPFTLTSKPTGRIIFVLTEVYATPEGVVDHFKQSEEKWKDFPAWKAFADKCQTTKVGAATIEASLVKPW